MQENARLYVIVLLLLLPTTAYAHGSEILAFPASWLTVLLVGLGLILARYRAFWLRLGAGLILATVVTSAVVAYLIDTLPFYVAFWALAVDLVLPPLLVCCLIGERLRRSFRKRPR